MTVRRSDLSVPALTARGFQEFRHQVPASGSGQVLENDFSQTPQSSSEQTSPPPSFPTPLPYPLLTSLQPAAMSGAVPRDEKTSQVSTTVVAAPQPAYMNTVPTLPYAAESHPASTTATVSDDKTEASSLEEKGGPIWEGYREDEIPDKLHGHYFSNIRFQIFSLYRRLFGIVFVTNMAIFIAAAVRGGTNTDAKYLGLVSVANLFVAILMRQAYVINAWYTVALWTPRSWPLWARRVIARVYSIGGIHSGSAVSGTVWLVLFAAKATQQFIHKDKITVPTIVFTYIILALLISMIIFAYPRARTRHHDTFEMVHRFSGWTAVALVWCLIVFLVKDYKSPGESLGHALVHAVPFWLVVIITGSIILPWLRLKKVNVESVVLSEHCVRFNFDYVNTVPGHFTRLSHNPLFEWHSFATIAVPGKDGHSVIISRAGDWTSEQIANPPTKIWIRDVPTLGVVSVTTLFRRAVVVATGSGIAPIAPVVYAKKIPLQLLWVAANVRKTFGDPLVDSLIEANPNAAIYDTRVHGKPDMVKLTYRLVKEFDAEAVVIISNEPLTKKVVYGLMSRGIPAFGAIWDS